MQSTLNYRPLTEPISSADIAAFRTDLRNAGLNWDQYAGSRADFPLLVGGGMLILPLVPLFIAIVSFRSPFAILEDIGGLGALFLDTLLYLALVGAVVTLLYRRGRDGWERLVRLGRFAWANEMTYLPAAPATRHPGVIFTTGSSHATTDLFQTHSGRTIHIGRHSYVSGFGKSSRTHYWDFLAIRLDRRLPHMILDSRENNEAFGETNLPRPIANAQRLSLEGDFDRYFTLYCPKEYERDALYIFTPDLMALLIDNVAPFDVEIVDDWMYVYSDADLDLVDPFVQMRLASIAATVGAKTLSQSSRYVDHRVGVFEENTIAGPGRRLRSVVPREVVYYLLAGVVLTIWIVFLFQVTPVTG